MGNFNSHTNALNKEKRIYLKRGSFVSYLFFILIKSKATAINFAYTQLSVIREMNRIVKIVVPFLLLISCQKDDVDTGIPKNENSGFISAGME